MSARACGRYTSRADNSQRQHQFLEQQPPCRDAEPAQSATQRGGKGVRQFTQPRVGQVIETSEETSHAVPAIWPAAASRRLHSGWLAGRPSTAADGRRMVGSSGVV